MESVGGIPRGADDDLVLAAFCEAHAFEHQLVVLGEERADEGQHLYTLWTIANWEQQYRHVVGERKSWGATSFAKAFAERASAI